MLVDRATVELVTGALTEDLGDGDLQRGDLTTDATVPPGATGEARIVQKEKGVVYGLDVAAEAFRLTGGGVLQVEIEEGIWREEIPSIVARIGGPARGLLAGERVALNFLGRLSGIATLTAKFVAAASSRGGKAVILDTRKTTPLLRALEKAAVRAGGGENHRVGLYDAILIKENHIALAGGTAAAVRAARDAHPELLIEVECQNAGQVEAALAVGAGRLLLDNMDLEGLRSAVAVRDRRARDAEASPIPLEASGGVNLENVGAISATGVDYISVGALTHSAPSLDLSLLLDGRMVDPRKT